MKLADKELTLPSASAQDTHRLGCILGQELQERDWIGLSGDLGAGKTCLTGGLAEGLQVTQEHPVTSPTFVVLQTYPGRIRLHHLDLYRLQSFQELVEIGYQDLLNDQAACVVEWCDQLPASRPQDGLLITIKLISITERELKFTALGERGLELVKSLEKKYLNPDKSC